MGNLLLHRGDAARVFALDDIRQPFGQLRMYLFHANAVLYDIDGYVGVNIAQRIQIQFQLGINLNDILFAHFLAGRIFNQRNGCINVV